MPISKENRKLYPKNWKALSLQIRKDAKNKCELCDAKNHKLHPITKSNVVLTVHHLDFNPRNNELWNLIALCQRCHNRIDRKWRAKNRRLKKGKQLF